jgi:hypothetical protein
MKLGMNIGPEWVLLLAVIGTSEMNTGEHAKGGKDKPGTAVLGAY